MPVQHVDIRFSMFLRCKILEADGLTHSCGVIILETTEKPM
jgi:hypothetical protein